VDDLHQAITGGGIHTIDPTRIVHVRLNGRFYAVVAVSVGPALGHGALILDAADIPGESGPTEPTP
jgi:hypothetical protein